METIVRPFTPTDKGSELGPTFMVLRSGEGEEMILNQNIFVERLLPHLVMRKLSHREMDEYRRPFLKSGTVGPRWRGRVRFRSQAGRPRRSSSSNLTRNGCQKTIFPSCL